ncbi:uncharacterized protein EAF02_007328 [Botrytis sinoallii]|uniref:uncharacterized protein n=1 Tax=Botrytis sinoallii TaxID=1463999 RepID=UPI001900AC19|nr:uncharacterized protein EAF02_007328 [Botrytis sinoallii]KAF7880482.1 hypothetical protein EAF02_007328 [Botrytis sinoallii]
MQTNEYNPESKKGIHEDVIREIDTITASWEGIMQRESVHEAVRRFYESDDRLNVELPMETLPEHVIQQQQVNLNQRLQDMVATIKRLLDFQEYPQTQGNKRAIRIAINALLSAVYEDMHGGRNPHNDNKIHPSANPHTDPRHTLEFLENSLKKPILCPWHIDNPDYCIDIIQESTNQNWAN